MKRRDLAKRVPGDSVHLSVHHQTDRSGWLRKFCGRGIFRELWRNRYVSLRGEHLLLSDKEVKDDRRFQEVFSLCEYERSEELRKTNRRSKKNHSRFTLLKEPGSVVPNLVFLAVSPEEKELWVNALNSAIVRAKNHVLDEVTLEENSVLVHPTRDRVRIPQSRRLPTRGHLLAVASSSCSMLTLDLVAEEEDGTGRESPWENRFRVDLEEVGRGGGVWGGYYGDVGVIGRRRAGTDVSKLRVTSGREVRVKTSSLPRGSERSWGPKHPPGSPHLHRTQHMHQGQGQPRTPQPGKRASVQGRSRCSSMDGVLSCRPVLRSAQRRGPTEEQAGGQQSDGQPAGQLHNLIAQKMQRAQELLEEMRLQELQKAERGRGGEHPYPRGVDSPRLHHLRASDSSHSRSPGSPRSRSSDSPRPRGKDSPRQRGRESPRSRAKKNRSKGNESQKSTESPRVLKVTASTCAKSAGPPGDPERPMDSCLPPDRLDGDSPKVPKSSESCQKAASSPCGSSDSESPPLLQRSFPASQSRKNFPSLSKSFDLPHPGSPASPISKTSLKDLLRQRSFDSSSPRSTPLPPSSSSSSSRPCQLSEEEESEVERRRAEAEHLLEEAVMSWREAQEVLQEVRDLQSRTLRRQRRQTYDKTMSSSPTTPPPSAETDIGLPMATAGGAEGEEEEEMEEEDPSILLTSPEDDQSEMA